MKRSHQLLTICAILFATISLSSCDVKVSVSHENNPYGIIEAEESGGLPDSLIECSQNEKCPKYAQALFWVAADILSEASSATFEVEGKGFELTEDMSIEEMTEIVGPIVEKLLDSDPPKYDFKDPESKRGFMMLKKASRAGSIYASNELGVFYLEQSAMQNFALAKMYFKNSLNKGDTISAYNLARTIRKRSPDDKESILKYLKIATKTKEADMLTAYMLGLKYFGSGEEKLTSLRYFETNKETNYKFSVQEFEAHFDLNEPKKISVP